MREFLKFTLDDKGKSAEDAGYVASPSKVYKDEIKELDKYKKILTNNNHYYIKGWN